ncbi:DUF1580 domain-containing protein [Frigoriglobus tundricola]|uniref:Uncharacterized protein n=1 Tax=Frigoriglobus tundricola TaxID=2774151 RepID=A0A6M5YNQ7_9BACT|nr:DUF1580 domain-containing protein [Frigoriglobus tundricola]QJW94602.1 hypothetical protein FTUN_2124 [Frigoriglobus tundricola]
MTVKALQSGILTSVVSLHVLDLVNEEVVTFAELARRLGRRRANRPTHVATIHRWRLRGLNGVRLAAAKSGGIWVTTVQAYQRFVDAITQAASPEAKPPAGTPRASADQTDRSLDALGL